jgi:hypothetical protein
VVKDSVGGRLGLRGQELRATVLRGAQVVPLTTKWIGW